MVRILFIAAVCERLVSTEQKQKLTVYELLCSNINILFKYQQNSYLSLKKDGMSIVQKFISEKA